MYSIKWDDEKNVPYVLKTHLLDSYYCLPERPDMAFTFLWKCINNTYSNYQRKTSTKVEINDGVLLDYIINGISKKLNDNIDYKHKSYTLKQLIETYMNKIPDKVLKFMTNYILKSYVVSKIIIDKRYVSSSHNTFKSNFEDIYTKIVNTYGEEYLKLCSPIKSNGEVNLNISDKEKSKKITRSLSQKLKELIINKETEIVHSSKKDILKIADDEEYIKFIIKNILYAIRNNTVHGKIASRLNSDYVNANSFQSSKYVYLLGYMFLSIMLYISDELSLDELSFNFENTKYL